jgi:hypothetical protein
MTLQEETTVRVTDDADLIIGVDTHLDTHTAAICDARGRAVSQMQVPATTAGYEQLLAWVRAAARDRQAVWAVEGTRHYGLGLARYLTSQGQQVSEIDCRATRSTPSEPPANYSPGPGLHKCAPTGTAKRCGC